MKPRLCLKTRSGVERPFSRLAASGCIDDRTNPPSADFAVFARRKNGSRLGRRRGFQTEPSVAALSLCLLPLFACACRFERQPTLKGSGTIAQETRSLADFTKVSIWGTGDIQITQGQEESLGIACDDNFMEAIESRIEGGTLYIGPKRVILKPTQTIKYNLQLKELKALQCSGALSIHTASLTCSDLHVTANGVCSLDIENLQAESITTTANGASKVTIASGKAKEQIITLNGAGQYQTPNLDTNDLTITINGTGQATLWATQSLKASLHGAGNISYYGSPRVSQSVAGVGRIKSLGEKEISSQNSGSRTH